MMALAQTLVQVILLLLLAPLVSGLIKKCKALLQNRRGPHLLQVYCDILKLLRKDCIFSSLSTWVFRLSPFIYFATIAGAAAILPLGGQPVPGDLFLLAYLFAAGQFWLALAALDTASAFSGMGASREMFFAALLEPVLLLALLTVALPAQSPVFAAWFPASPPSLNISHLLAAASFYIVLLAETGRIPFDNPDTHLELTMVHEGMILDHSGRGLGLIHLAVALRQLIFFLLFALFFLPGRWFDLWWLDLGAKVFCTAIAVAVTETSTNKVRLFMIPKFLATAAFFALLALIAH